MRFHMMLNVILVIFATTQVQGRTLTIQLEFARMDTCTALPSDFSYTGMGFEELTAPKTYLPKLIDPMVSELKIDEYHSFFLIWGRTDQNEKKLSCYLADDLAKSASKIPFNFVEKWGEQFYEGIVAISETEDQKPKLLLSIYYNPTQKMLMYRRMDFRLGSVSVNGRNVKVALTSGNEFAFQKTNRNYILIDQDGDGQFRMESAVDSLGKFQRTEAYRTGQPLPLGSAAYEIVYVSPDGWELELAQTRADTGLNVGLEAPDLIVETLDGQTINMAELKGKVVVLNWWHIRCSPCIAEMPSMNNLVTKYASESVIFLAIADNTPAELEGFFEKHRFDYRIALCSDELKKMLGETYPRHIIIDPTGVVAYDHTGGSDNKTGPKLDGVIAALK